MHRDYDTILTVSAKGFAGPDAKYFYMKGSLPKHLTKYIKWLLAHSLVTTWAP